MKVLFLSIVPSPYQRDLFASLQQQEGIEIDVHYAEGESPDSPWPKADLASYETVYKSFYLSWSGKRFIVNYQYPNWKNYDAIVLNGYVTLPAQFALRKASGKVPLLFWGEKMEHAQGGLRERIQTLLTSPMHRLDAIVAIGKKAYRDYAVTFPGVPVYEVPYYCQIASFQETIPERPRDPVRILFCGQMIQRKGVDVLLKAFSGLTERFENIRLVLVGREAELAGMLSEVPEAVREKIDFEGFQSPKALPRFFAGADIFVLPSRYDGWGVVVNQALGAGLPVICSDAVGAAEDLVEEGKNGYIVQAGDVESLYEALAELVHSPQKIRNFGKYSLELSRKLTPEQGARDWMEILKKVVGN